MYPNCLPDIMIKGFSRYFVHKVALLYKMPKSEKGDNLAKYLHNVAKVNQVIYTLDTIYEPNIMILAQAVLEIFCSQRPLWVKC